MALKRHIGSFRSPNVKGMMKLIGNIPRTPIYGLKDSDRDGVINVMDCQPNNPRKQGFIHDAIKRANERARERKEIREEARIAGVKEKRIQAIKTAEARERFRAERKREFIRKGGIGGALTRALIPPKKLMAVAGRVKQKKDKKRKKRKTVTKTVATQPQRPRRLEDIPKLF